MLWSHIVGKIGQAIWCLIPCSAFSNSHLRALGSSGSLLCPIVCVNISVLCVSTLVGPFVFSRARCHSSATLTALQGHQRWKGPYGGRGERAGLRKMTSVCHLYINICVRMWQATERRVSARAGSPNSIHTSISQSVPDLNKTQYQMIGDANY